MPYPLGHGGSYETWVFQFYECPRQKGTIFPHPGSASQLGRSVLQPIPVSSFPHPVGMRRSYRVCRHKFET